jgi:hypothetical protein
LRDINTQRFDQAKAVSIRTSAEIQFARNIARGDSR